MTKREGQVPCVFRGSFVREQVDPRIKKAWPSPRIPWGDLRRTWKAEHCLRVSGTGQPEDCPYSEEECAMSFLQCAMLAVDKRRPAAYFRTCARTKGQERADNKPLTREGDPAGPDRDLGSERDTSLIQGLLGEEEARLYGRRARPVGIGELLGSYDLGPRQGRTDDGEKGSGR